ncbi:MAG: SpoIID/LytB domain-containing protein [Candidatus Limnocylindrales bacterium]
MSERRRSATRAALAGLLAVSLAGLTALPSSLPVRLPAVQVPVARADDLDAERAKLAQLIAQAKAKEARLADLGQQHSALSKQLAAVELSAARTEEQIAETELQIVDIQVVLQSLNGRLADLAAQEATMRQGVANGYRVLYDQGQETGLEAFLGGDFVGWITRESSTDLIVAHLRDLGAQLRVAQGETRRRLADRQAAETKLERTRVDLAARKADLAKTRQQLVQLIASVSIAESLTKVALRTARNQVATASLTVSQLEAEQKALAAKEAAASSGGVSSVIPLPAGSPGANLPPPPPGTLTFYGRGTDHGLGLSQWGAYGRARAGQSAAQILAHYYQGTSLGSLAATAQVRVLVVDGYAATAASPARVFGRGGTWTLDGLSQTFPVDASFSLFPSGGGWQRVVKGPDGSILAQSASTGDEWVRPANAATTLQVEFRRSTFDTYRGAIHLAVSGSQVVAVDQVSMEDYLLGVVPAESPTSWPAAALQAQAVAARSYAWYQRDAADPLFDLYDDTRSQMYLGTEYEQPATTAAVRATADQVLLSGGRVIDALFHSTAGGATENNENVFVAWNGARLASPASYLRGSPDRDPSGVPYDAASPHAVWRSASYTYGQLSAVLANDPRTAVGELQSIQLTNRGVSGRLITVTLVGSGGTKTVSGPYFKYVFNVYTPASDPPLWSTLFAIQPIG